jgi:cytochrome c
MKACLIVQGTQTSQKGNAMRAITIFAALSVAVLVAGPARAQDAAAGEKVFAKCKICHVADKDQNKVGPSLHGVIGRTAGTHPGFKYSPAMIEAGKSGIVWDEATLTKYLHDPKAMVKGTKMAFPGLKDDKDIANVIAYLEQESKK